MITKSSFGESSVGESTLYTIENKNHMQIQVSDYGALLVRVLVPDQKGNLVDVVLGYEESALYEKNAGASLGATLGRVTNRIKGGSFELNGKTYSLTTNDGENTLHGGRDFYHTRKWTAMMEDNAQEITFSLFSDDMDQGFPGAVDITVSYELTDDNEVKITYHAVPDEDTLINMTNHSYFNLDGHDQGTILNQYVTIDADQFVRADEASIPTGELLDVTDTPMDFRKKKTVGQDIEQKYEALIYGNGYDHNYVLNHPGTFRKVAEMHSEKTGITMEVHTDLPGMQLYSGNFIDGTDPGKEGVHYVKRSGLCFETQYFPDAIHHDNFEGPIVKAKEAFHTTTIYKFKA